MNRNKIFYAAAALLVVGGCGKSTNTANSPDANSPSGQQQASAPAQPIQIVVPAGTNIPVVLTTGVNSYKNQQGDEFEGSIASAVIVEGADAIPKGAKVRGTVVTAKKQGAIKGQGELSVTLTSIRVGGKDYTVETSTYGAAQKGKGKRSAVMTGGGAAVGALIGGLAGGGKGAVIGAGAGGGGGLAASAGTGGHNVEFPPETRITFTLKQAITIQR